MRIDRLSLRTFRSWADVEFHLAPGLTVVVGHNGAGKTNVLEAIGYLSTLRSFRGAPTEALVQTGSERAVVRAAAVSGERSLLLEAEIVPSGRSRMLVNKQPLGRTRDLRDALVVSAFSPDDLELVKGGPGQRRDYLDELLEVLHPRNGALLRDLDRVLRQRNALLKQAGGRLTPEIALTLDVWDAKFVEIGEALGGARAQLVDDLRPHVERAYVAIAEHVDQVEIVFAPDVVSGALAQRLVDVRIDDVRRGSTTTGPQRDEVDLRIGGRASRTHASQGEQRTLALALRLGAHRFLTEKLGSAPILLLDDVFSELDGRRSDALIRELPPGQALLATAGTVPPSAAIEAQVRVVRTPSGSRRSSVDKPGDSVEESASDRVETREVIDPSPQSGPSQLGTVSQGSLDRADECGAVREVVAEVVADR